MTGKYQSSPLAALLWAAVVMCAWESVPAAVIPSAKVREVAIPVYAEGESNAVAVLRAERVGREHRRLGFFRVKLLPMVVVEGVRLEVAPSGLRDGMLAGVQAGLEPLAGKVPFEFRGFQMFLPGEQTPRLSARRVRPAPASGPPAWILEQVTVQSKDGPRVLPRATLLLEGEPGRLVWQEPADAGREPLSHGTLVTNQLALITASR